MLRNNIFVDKRDKKNNTSGLEKESQIMTLLYSNTN